MQHLVRTIVSALVDYPEAVEVQQVDGETTCILEVRVSPEDIGKVIGRQGRNIAALRTLLHAVGAKERKHVLLEVLEEPHEHATLSCSGVPLSPGRHSQTLASPPRECIVGVSETIASLPGFLMVFEEPVSYSLGSNIRTRKAK